MILRALTRRSISGGMCRSILAVRVDYGASPAVCLRRGIPGKARAHSRSALIDTPRDSSRLPYPLASSEGALWRGSTPQQPILRPCANISTRSPTLPAPVARNLRTYLSLSQSCRAPVAHCRAMSRDRYFDAMFCGKPFAPSRATSRAFPAPGTPAQADVPVDRATPRSSGRRLAATHRSLPAPKSQLGRLPLASRDRLTTVAGRNIIRPNPT